MLTEKNIPFLTMVFPIISIFILSSFISYFFITNQYENFEKEAKVTEERYILEQKAILEKKVEYIIADIKQSVLSMQDSYKKSMKDKVEQGIKIFNYLYYKKGERDKMLYHDALTPIRWNSGRGYYFALDLTGNMFMHPINSTLEGKNLLNRRDIAGNYPIKDFINIAVNRKEGYSKYFWEKPENDEVEMEKESYIKLFEPLNIIIGTGEYLDVIDNSIKDEILIRLKRMNLLNSEDYIFILDKNGKVILHPYIQSGKNIIHLEDKTGMKFVKELIDSSNNGGYIEYFWRDIEGSKELKKISFTRDIGYWDWVIGTGIYMESIDKKIKHRKLQLEDNIERDKNSILIIVFGISIVVTIISILLSKTINITFKSYSKKLLDRELELIDLNKKLESKVNYEIRARIDKEQKIIKQTTDNLTNLPNREKLLQDIEESVFPKLVILNIDRFKEINEYYGHHIGDKVIIRTGEIIKSYLDATKHKLYRLVGDEFAILADEQSTLQDLMKLLNIILKGFDKNNFSIDDYEFNIDITVGISVEKKGIYIHAEMAMKNGKDTNQNINFYDGSDDIQKKYENNLTWTKKLKDAIKDDRIVVFIQAIVDNKNENKRKYECLVRLKDRNGDYKSPYYFLDIAKKARQYESITRVVIDKSFAYFEDKDVEFSINLTIDDFLNKDTMRYLTEKLKKFKRPKNLVLEIVESEGIENFKEIRTQIDTFRGFGVKIAIDDFGTGYSNFDYLMQLNVDYIKIDGSLIKTLDENRNSQIVVNLIVQFAKNLNIKTVGEFVHSKAILDKVKEMGIDYSQGFYLHEPTIIE